MRCLFYTVPLLLILGCQPSTKKEEGVVVKETPRSWVLSAKVPDYIAALKRREGIIDGAFSDVLRVEFAAGRAINFPVSYVTTVVGGDNVAQSVDLISPEMTIQDIQIIIKNVSTITPLRNGDTRVEQWMKTVQDAERYPVLELFSESSEPYLAIQIRPSVHEPKRSFVILTARGWSSR